MTALTFAAPWAGAAVAVVAVAAAVLVVRRWRRPQAGAWGAEAAITNVEHAAASPRFRARWRRYRVLVGVEALALSVAVLAGVGLMMRPLTDSSRERAALSRDVMLCLDVSGSMRELDESLLRQFVDIASGLPGERLGLTVWNGSAITLFPLTDDAEYVRSTLEFAIDQLNRFTPTFLAGTEVGGASLIGDGLASCVLRFDRPDEPRARSIVLATDNALAGQPTIPLSGAAELARERGIRVYAIATADQITPEDARELEAAAVGTGGAYLTTDDERVVDTVVARIGELEATHLRQPPEVVRDEHPAAWAAAALAAVAALGAISWGLKR